MRRRTAAALCFGLTVYLTLRLVFIPADPPVVGGFQHDACYHAIVAGQILAGHGFVNPARWLLFLPPDGLPVPYHNANPGYTVLEAVVSRLSGVSTGHAGLIISAASNALLAAAAFLIVIHFVKRWTLAAFGAAAVAFFPANFADSLTAVPDALCTSLTIAAFAVLIRRNLPLGSASVGVLLALAWLARSSASVAAVAAIVFLFRTRPRRDAVRAAVVMISAFGAVISPWLWHTWHVWGHPFRSDAGFYLLQDYYARSFGGHVDKVWHSLDMPPSLTTILESEPWTFLTFYVGNIPTLVYKLGDEMGRANVALCGLLACVAAVRLKAVLRTAEFQAGVVFVVLTLAILNVRAPSVELRYVAPCLTLFVFLLIAAVVSLVLEGTGEWQWTSGRGMTAVLIAGAVLIGLQDVRIARKLTAPDGLNATYRAVFRRLADLSGDSVVVTPKPYLYTLVTGRSAVSPPTAEKAVVLTFMSNYSARYLALPTERLAYYYPDVDGFAPELTPVRAIGPFTIFERLQ